jgi:hypothetical protein
MITIALQAVLIITLALTGGLPLARAISRRRTIRRRLGIVGRRTR